MKALDLTNINSAKPTENKEEIKKLPPGTYVCEIVTVEDKPVGSIPSKPDKGDYLEITYDISEGPYTGYFADMASRVGFWPGKLYRSYKDGPALNMFKHFIRTVEKSNPSLSWDLCGINDEHALEGCKIGLVLKDDTYQAMDGTVKHKLTVDKIITVDEARWGSNATDNAAKVAPVIVAGA